MSLNTYTFGFKFKDLPEFCGPDDLSEAIISLRNPENEGFSGLFAPISDDGVRRLIKLAFSTSLVAEEGTTCGKSAIWIISCAHANGPRLGNIEKKMPILSQKYTLRTGSVAG